MSLPVSSVLKAAYKQPDVFILRTIQFLVNDQHFFGLCKSFTDEVRDANGSSITYLASDLELTFSAREASIRNGIRFSFSVTRQNFASFRNLFEYLSYNENTATLVYREYVNSDTTAQFAGLPLIVTKISYKEPSLIIDASFEQIADAEFPFTRYFPQTFPTLKAF